MYDLLCSRSFRRLLAGCTVAAITLLGAPVPGAAQDAARYQVQTDTLRYTSDNPYHLYWVRGTDTVGTPQRDRGVEAHVWGGTRERPQVVIRDVSLDLGRRTTTHAFTLAPDGRVEAIDGRPPMAQSRIDLLLRLPGVPLRTGTTWSDTVRASGTDPGGPQWYEVVRTYRMARLLDTLGVRGVADVEAQGSVRYRFGFWADSAAGRSAWLDVAGPVTERYLFDTAGGRLLRREWDMELRGRGVAPTGPDTVAAGLRSRQVIALADDARIRFLLAPLPGADTAVTVVTATGAPILLHTVQRSSDRIRSSMARNDGMLGVATLTFEAGRVLAYQATWADSTGLDSLRIRVQPGSVVLQRQGARDTVLPLPAGSWSVADYAMHELLAPALLALPRDGATHPLAVLRPVAGQWSEGSAQVRDAAGLVIATLRFEGSDASETLLFTQNGDYLFGESSGPVPSRRVPTDAARQRQLEQAVARLNGSAT